MNEVEIVKEMLGRTFCEVRGKKGDDVMLFLESDGSGVKFYHSQDCCESVAIEDIAGDLSDLVGAPIVQAEVVTNSETHPEGIEEKPSESFTWTFYKFATAKGSVTVRWLGESNRYYSESVEMELVKP